MHTFLTAFRALAGAILVAALPAAAQQITTYAGGGVGEQAPALNALLIRPSHLAFDRFNNLHVTDRGGHRILKITPAGTISTVVGTGIPGRLDTPMGFLPITSRRVNSPSGIAFRPTPFNFDPAVDELVFADTGNHWISAVDTVTATEPIIYREFGTSFQGYCCDNFNVFADFDTPQGLAVDAAGNVLIADTHNHIVRRLNWHDFQTQPTISLVAGIPQVAGSGGNGGPALEANLQHPRAVAVDAAGDIYVAESHRIRKITVATGVITTLVGATTPGFLDGAIGSALLDTPTDLRFDASGNLYFVDAGNARVRRIVAGMVETVAGTGAISDSGDGGLATASGLAGPRGLAFDANGHLFVTMYDSGKIRRIDAVTGVITTYAGGAVLEPDGGSFAGDGGLPHGLALRSPGGATPVADGSVYIADAFNHRVRFVDAATGVATTIAGDGTPGSTGDGGAATLARLDTPISVAVDASGNLYIAEANGGRVRRIDPGGTITTFLDGLLGPTWVVARGADVYIAEGAGHRIVKVTGGIPTNFAGTGTPGSGGDGGPATAASLDFPAGFAFDAAGNVFIAEAGGHRIRKVATDGTITTVAGTGAPGFSGDGGLATAATLDGPMGIAVDDAGALYIGDSNNHRIRKVLPGGTIKSIGGNGSAGFGGDGGGAPDAQLDSPTYVTRDAAGRLYVSDTGNHRIRRIVPRAPFAPALTTLTPGAGSITVAFTPPADDGNAPVIEYGVECHGPTAMGMAGTASPIVVSGLVDGGSYQCFAYARNAVNWGDSTPLSSSVVVGLAPSITSSAPPPAGTIGVAYAHAYTASGAPAPVFAVTAGALPAGLSLSPEGAVTGAPTQAGVFTGTVSATNGIAPAATQDFSITIAKLAATVALASSANPAVEPASVTFTVTLPGTPTPTGSVTFKDGGATLPLCAGITLVSGQAQCVLQAGAIGSHAITAEYGGDATWLAATSNVLSQAIRPRPPDISSPAQGANIAPNPTVSGGGTPGAVVTVREGPATVCTATVSGGNAWSCTTSLGAGSHAISATQALAGQASDATAARNFTITAPTELLTVSKAGTGGGTVVSNPAGVNCGATCGFAFARGAGVTLTATPAAGSVFAGWSGACAGTGTCVVTMSAARSVTATFTATSAGLTLDPSSYHFTGQSMGTASFPAQFTVTNTGNATLTVSSITVNTPQFAVFHDCATVAPAAGCGGVVYFQPTVGAGALNAAVPVTGTLTIASDAPGSPHAMSLSGVAEKSLVTHYYNAILNRLPDTAGKDYWQAEAARLSALGVNVNETWFVMAGYFFNSAEYASFGNGHADFVGDLYLTFFNRAPDQGGLDYWVGQIQGGLPREVVLFSFMFSNEFGSFTQGIFGNTASRPEVDMVVDLFRGILNRLPDTASFNYWLGQIRAAQCAGAGPVYAKVDEMSAAFIFNPEYSNRARNNTQFVTDMYYSFLRRGGDIGGVQYWINELNTGARDINDVRINFINNPEFGARVQAIIAAGCAP